MSKLELTNHADLANKQGQNKGQGTYGEPSRSVMESKSYR